MSSKRNGASFSQVVREPQLIGRWVKDHQHSVQLWTAFVVLVGLVAVLLSDREFSFFLTLSSMVSFMSFVMIAYKVESSRSGRGLSHRMVSCYAMVTTSRFISTAVHEGYLPSDSTGDWFYQLCECGTMICCAALGYRIHTTYKATLDEQESQLKIRYLAATAVILAVLLHPKLNKSFITDSLWAFSVYMEAVAGLPQLVMFHQEGQIQSFTVHFLAGQVLSKILSFIFWYKTASELNGKDEMLPGLLLIVMQAVQLLVMGDFFYQYVNCLRQGKPVQFILAEQL